MCGSFARDVHYPGFKSILIHASQPYKEDMNTQSSGTMTDDEIKRYSYALTENSDGDVPCPRCEVFESLKSNSWFQIHDEICGYSTHATFISRLTYGWPFQILVAHLKVFWVSFLLKLHHNT